MRRYLSSPLSVFMLSPFLMAVFGCGTQEQEPRRGAVAPNQCQVVREVAVRVPIASEGLRLFGATAEETKQIESRWDEYAKEVCASRAYQLDQESLYAIAQIYGQIAGRYADARGVTVERAGELMAAVGGVYLNAFNRIYPPQVEYVSQLQSAPQMSLLDSETEETIAQCITRIAEEAADRGCDDLMASDGDEDDSGDTDDSDDADSGDGADESEGSDDDDSTTEDDEEDTSQGEEEENGEEGQGNGNGSGSSDDNTTEAVVIGIFAIAITIATGGAALVAGGAVGTGMTVLGMLTGTAAGVGGIAASINDCVAARPVSGYATSYLLPRETAGRQLPPTTADAVNACFCGHVGSDAEDLVCPEDEEDRTRQECMANPYGPDDAPRPECRALLVDDALEAARIINPACTLIQCPRGSVAVGLVSRAASSDSVSILDCGCGDERMIFDEMLGEPPGDSYGTIDCGPDAVPECSGAICRCVAPGTR